MEKTVLHHQNFVDLSLMANGTATAIIANAMANNRSVTDELSAGENLTFLATEDDNTNVINYYKAYIVRPATAITDVVATIIDNEDPCNLCKCFT
tara:strand:+ start:38682 stop:38966 length:285 start_codon:yes stop_codon:yes gene_type:complete